MKHRDLIGVELHNARVSLEAPTRQPRYPGETVFDGTRLWISKGTTASDWSQSSPPPPPPPSLPPIFSWVLNLSAIVLPTGTQISLYYRQPSANDTWNNDAWTLLRRYTTGTDLPVLQGAPNGAINLNGWIEQHGLGLYMPLLVRADDTAIPTSLNIRSLLPERSVSIEQVGRWAEPGTSRVYENARAFEVSSCIAAFVGDVLQGAAR